jgi:hypothetical protein
MCPSCNSKDGLREIIYGLPSQPIDESKYAIGGCCPPNFPPIWTCINCKWEGWSLNNENGIKLSDWSCPICRSVGKIELIALNTDMNAYLRNNTYKIEVSFGEMEQNAMCQDCGWKTHLVKTYSY